MHILWILWNPAYSLPSICETSELQYTLGNIFNSFCAHITQLSLTKSAAYGDAHRSRAAISAQLGLAHLLSEDLICNPACASIIAVSSRSRDRSIRENSVHRYGRLESAKVYSLLCSTEFVDTRQYILFF